MRDIESLKRARTAAVQPFIVDYPSELALPLVELYIKKNTLVLDAVDSIDYQNGQMWAHGINRSLARKTHAWFFLRYWYSAWNDLKEDLKEQILERIPRMLRSWKQASNEKGSMAYHDETTSQRVINFVVLFNTISSEIDDDLKSCLDKFIGEEIRILSSEKFYAGSNNHGMFQDLAILVAAAYGHLGRRAHEAEQKSICRLRDYFKDSFTDDGIHRENSPTYHLMVTRYLRQFVDYCEETNCSAEAEGLHAVLEKADAYAAFALTPANEFVPVSDTKKGRLGEATVRAAFGRGKTLAVITRGKAGECPSTKTLVAEKSGYAIYRSSWEEDANYLFFHAAYNADYHKHSDELSIFYQTHGRPIITEAGPYGYEYNDPLTKYAFSSWAHNTLLVNGEGLNRVDENAELTEIKDLGSNINGLDVEGCTGRYKGVDWRRRVEVPAEDNGSRVKVSDRVESTKENNYTILWHLGEGLKPVVRGNAVEIFDSKDDEKLCELTWSGESAISVKLTIGEKYSFPQGWIFPKMGAAKSAPVIEVEFRNSSISVDWEIRSSDFKLRDRGISPASAWRTYWAEKPVNFLLEDAKDSGIDRLAVVFTAMGQLYDFTYNYRASMQDFDGKVLYILDDFGDQGSYYLSSNRNLAEFRSVQSLIRTVVQDLGMSFLDVTMLGSSKGGTAALLHGTSLGVGHVYAGAPQYRIGQFVKDPHPNVLRYISGGTSDEDVRWADDIATKLLSSGIRSTPVTVVVGKRDGHYRHHSVPLVSDLSKLGYRPEHLVLPGTPHSELGPVFRKFLASFAEMARNPQEKLPSSLAYDKKDQTLGVVVSCPTGSRGRVQLFNGREKVGELIPLTEGTAQWRIKDSGSYRARVYVDVPGIAKRVAFGTPVVRV